MIVWLLAATEWRASFLWSHKSQAISQSFFMSSEVQCLLDLWLKICNQYQSCSIHQERESHPLNKLCHPISFCSSNHCGWWGELGMPDSSWYHACRLLSRPSWMLGDVCWSESHCLRALREVCQRANTDGAGHQRMWILSSWVAWKQGHWANERAELPLLHIFSVQEVAQCELTYPVLTV